MMLPQTRVLLIDPSKNLSAWPGPALSRAAAACQNPGEAEAMETLVSLGLVLSFAAWITAHVAIVAALASRARPWRALVGLVPPLAPFGAYWALKERMYIRTALWGGSLLAYIVFLAAAHC
jgi:hypothetical protein